MRVFVTQLITITILSSTSALAYTNGTPDTHLVAANGLWVGLAIAFLARRREIGGLLLFYYIQLYGSVLVIGPYLISTALLLSPSQWARANPYIWFLLGAVPFLAATIAQVGVASYLLYRRTAANVLLLQKVLVALMAFSFVAMLAGGAQLEDTGRAFVGAWLMWTSAAWAVYFYRSRRVRLVFVDRCWDFEAQNPSTLDLTQPERRYLFKRATVAGSVVFVGFLLLAGSRLGDAKPDLDIFIAPLYVATLTALVAWNWPIRPAKRDALAAAQPPTDLV
jgi:hypothetical protein